jgi:phosphoglucosamine mutase
MRRNEKPLEELGRVMEPFPQVLYNVEVQERKDLSQIPEIDGKVKTIEKTLGKTGRLLVRYSGTEPLLRIMVEGEDEDKLHQYARSGGSGEKTSRQRRKPP